MKINDLTKEEYENLFDVDFEAGVLYWKINKASNAMAGSIPGGKNNNKSIQISIDNKKYSAHRIIWIMAYGNIPNNLRVIHLDNNRSNNSLKNLAVKSQSEACSMFLRTKPNKRNKSGFKTGSVRRKGRCLFHRDRQIGAPW